MLNKQLPAVAACFDSLKASGALNTKLARTVGVNPSGVTQRVTVGTFFHVNLARLEGAPSLGVSDQV